MESGVRDVSIFHTEERAASDDPALLSALDRANGVDSAVAVSAGSSARWAARDRRVPAPTASRGTSCGRHERRGIGHEHGDDRLG